MMKRKLCSPPWDVRAARAVMGGGCFGWGESPPILPGLSGLSGLLEAEIFLNGEVAPSLPRATRAVRGRGCFE